MFPIKFPTNHTFHIFHILKINEKAPFVIYLQEDLIFLDCVWSKEAEYFTHSFNTFKCNDKQHHKNVTNYMVFIILFLLTYSYHTTSCYIQMQRIGLKTTAFGPHLSLSAPPFSRLWHSDLDLPKTICGSK